MEKNRLISILCALIAAILVIMAGKSCADDAVKKNGGNKGSDGSSATTEGKRPSYNIVYPTGSLHDDQPADTSGTDAAVTDESGNIVEPTTEMMYEEVTDVFGNVIETIPITTITDETTVDPESTTTLSPLDQYNEDQKNPNKYSGFYHGEEGAQIGGDRYYTTPPATIPPDFVIDIN